MEFSSVVSQTLLFAHLIAFALAIAEVLSADWRLLRGGTIDVAALESISRLVKWLLAVLWVTGLALIYMKIGLDFGALVANSKLMAKLAVVGLLTMNGVLLHLIAFPRIARGDCDRQTVLIVTILGTVSTTTWIYASFVGAARIVAADMNLATYAALYAAALAVSMTIALTIVRRFVEIAMTNLQESLPENLCTDAPITLPVEKKLQLLREVEIALQALGNAHNQLMSLRSLVMRNGEITGVDRTVPAFGDGSQHSRRAQNRVMPIPRGRIKRLLPQ